MRVEHDYRRGGALAYLAAWDVHRGQVIGRCEDSTGIEPFARLVEQVMTAEPYTCAERVFWLMDNGSSHRGQASIDRMSTAWPNAHLVDLPVHASWLDQCEIYLSVVQRKVLTPNDSSTWTRSANGWPRSRPATTPSPHPSTGLHLPTGRGLDELAETINPIVAGWINYYGLFYRSKLYPLLQRINTYLMRWAGKKYKRLRAYRRFTRWWFGIVDRNPELLPTGDWCARSQDCDETSGVTGDSSRSVLWEPGGEIPPGHPASDHLL